MSIWDTITRNVNRVTRSTFAGDSVVYYPINREPFSIRAPYWREHYQAQPDTEAMVRSTNPKVNVLHEDLQGITLSTEDRFEVDGITWGVERIEDDKAQHSSFVYLTKIKKIL